MEIASKFTILRGHPPRPLSNLPQELRDRMSGSGGKSSSTTSVEGQVCVGERPLEQGFQEIAPKLENTSWLNKFKPSSWMIVDK